MRNITIVTCLVATAVIGVAAILSHRWALQSVIFYVFAVWLLADLVVSGVFSRNYWKTRNRPLAEMYREGTWPRQGGGAIGRVTRIGSAVFMLIFLALYFI
jgi:hypothetical protein